MSEARLQDLRRDLMRETVALVYDDGEGDPAPTVERQARLQQQIRKLTQQIRKLTQAPTEVPLT